MLRPGELLAALATITLSGNWFGGTQVLSILVVIAVVVIALRAVNLIDETHFVQVLGILAALAAVVVALQMVNIKKQEQACRTKENFGYEGDDGPPYWCGDCQTGRRQSPINIDTTTAVWNPHIEPPKLSGSLILVGTQELELKHGGIEISIKPSSNPLKLTFGGKTYEAAEIHHHNPSEHHVNTHYYPGEIHLVFKNSDATSLIVLAMFMDSSFSSPSPNPDFVEQFKGHFPTPTNPKRNIGKDITLEPLLVNAELTQFWMYLGSLTTPTCAEKVTFIVLQQPVLFSHAHLRMLRTNTSFNARPTQPLNGRTVTDVHP